MLAEFFVVHFQCSKKNCNIIQQNEFPSDMSHLEENVIIFSDEEDDEFDDFLFDSSKNSSRDSRLSLTQKKKSSGYNLPRKSKSQPVKLGNKKNFQFKRKNNWLSPSFDGFGSVNHFNDDLIETVKTRKKECYDDFPSKGTSVNLWIDKHKPQSESELAVHKKKLEEVRSWLLNHLSSKSNEILLLTGPVGVGKTATISVLSNELDFEVQEWINPTSYGEGISFENEYSQSQLAQFQDFLLRSNKYPSLNMFGSSKHTITQRKVILIEDLPNLFYRDSKKLHATLLEFRQKGRCPLILIISDSHSTESNLHKLLPKAIQLKLDISIISFNPVANTSLVKTLNRIVSLESKEVGRGFSLLSKDVINELVQSSSGDIRTAINALQFSCQKGVQGNMTKYKSTNSSFVTKTQKKDTNKKATKVQDSQAKKMSRGSGYNKDEKEDQHVVVAVGGKDTTIFLFKALGRILYCKRDPSISDKHLLPPHLSHLARNQAQFCPEEVVEKSHLSSEILSLYLHQNYLDFFTDIDDVVAASNYISDANTMSLEYMHRSALIPYMSCIATRGLMYNNNHRSDTNSSTSRGGWRPLIKPQWFDVNNKARDNCLTAKELFPEQTCTKAVLYSEIIPYLAITDVPLRSPGQISFVQQMGQYKTHKLNTRSTETLDEKECGISTEDEPTDSQTFSQDNLNSKDIDYEDENQDLQEFDTVFDVKSDEDIIIEDFEDDW